MDSDLWGAVRVRPRDLSGSRAGWRRAGTGRAEAGPAGSAEVRQGQAVGQTRPRPDGRPRRCAGGTRGHVRWCGRRSAPPADGAAPSLGSGARRHGDGDQRGRHRHRGPGDRVADAAGRPAHSDQGAGYGDRDVDRPFDDRGEVGHRPPVGRDVGGPPRQRRSGGHRHGDPDLPAAADRDTGRVLDPRVRPRSGLRTGAPDRDTDLAGVRRNARPDVQSDLSSADQAVHLSDAFDIAHAVAVAVAIAIADPVPVAITDADLDRDDGTSGGDDGSAGHGDDGRLGTTADRVVADDARDEPR